jgi:hypothetical protein
MRRFKVPEIVLGFLLGIAASVFVAIFTPLTIVADPTGHAFWGLTAHGWTAVATIALAVVTAGLALAAIWQVWSIRDEATRTRTIEACDRYDTDPILDAALRALARAKLSGELDKTPEKFKTRLATVLNYLDAIAIGIDQELYIESLVKDHLEHVVPRTIELYIESGLAVRAGLNPGKNYHRLLALAAKWAR